MEHRELELNAQDAALLDDLCCKDFDFELEAMESDDAIIQQPCTHKRQRGASTPPHNSLCLLQMPNDIIEKVMRKSMHWWDAIS